MDQTTKTAVEPMHTPGGVPALRCGTGDLRTLKRYFLDLVLPALTLTGMSALTAVVLVLLVGAAADLNLHSHGQQTSPDPWSVACFGLACLWDGPTYPERSAAADMLDQTRQAGARRGPARRPTIKRMAPRAVVAAE